MEFSTFTNYIDKIRYENTKNLKEYLLGHYVANKEIVGIKEQMNYEVMLGLRKTEGINMRRFYEKFNTHIEDEYDINHLIRIGDLIKDKDQLYINPEKIYVMNEILLKIL